MLKYVLSINLFLFIVFGFKFFDKPKSYVFPKLNYFPEMPISKDNLVTEEGVSLGRYLFYDTILSKNKNMSCATCHQQSSAFSDAPNIYSIGNNDVLTQRNTLPLFNLAWYKAFFWDGRVSSIESQILHPVSHPNEMNLTWTAAATRINASVFYI